MEQQYDNTELADIAEMEEINYGKNPPSWVMDESVWAKAKKAVLGGKKEYENPYPVIVSVYKNMGGRVKGKNMSQKRFEFTHDDLTDEQWEDMEDAVMARMAELNKRGLYDGGELSRALDRLSSMLMMEPGFEKGSTMKKFNGTIKRHKRVSRFNADGGPEQWKIENANESMEDFITVARAWSEDPSFMDTDPEINTWEDLEKEVLMQFAYIGMSGSPQEKKTLLEIAKYKILSEDMGVFSKGSQLARAAKKKFGLGDPSPEEWISKKFDELWDDSQWIQLQEKVERATDEVYNYASDWFERQLRQAKIDGIEIRESSRDLGEKAGNGWWKGFID